MPETHSQLAPSPGTKAPALSTAARTMALERTHHYFVRAEQVYGRKFPRPEVLFNLRGVAAGKAIVEKTTTGVTLRTSIRYNAVLLQENEDYFRRQTIPHEVAHLIAWWLSSTFDHGPAWQQVMADFGVPATQRHRLDVTRSRVQRGTPFKCGCPTLHHFMAKKTRQANRGRMHCLRCGQTLVPANPVAVLPKQPVRVPARPATPTRPAAPVRAMPIPVAPARRPASVAPSVARPAAARVPTAAMVSFAQDLAKRTGLSLPAAALKQYEACSVFIDKCKNLPARQAPTERQLQYARDIARRRGVVVPSTAIGDATKLSQWIAANR